MNTPLSVDTQDVQPLYYPSLRLIAFGDFGLENLLPEAIRALHPSRQVVRWSIARVCISLAQGFLSAGRERPLAPEPGA